MDGDLGSFYRGILKSFLHFEFAIVTVFEVMEKERVPLIERHDESVTSSTGSERQSFAPNSRAVRTVVFVIIFCLGLFRVSGILEKTNATHNGSLSVHQRAEAILKKNPLIGLSSVQRLP